MSFRELVTDTQRLGMAVVASKAVTDPASADTGLAYIVAASAIGVWAGQDGNLAYYEQEAWKFITPLDGYQVIVDNENDIYTYHDSAWVAGKGGVVVANGDTLTVTKALHAGKTINFGKLTGTIATLPAATGSGDVYEFVIGITATSNANIIKVANATDVMDGSVNLQQDTDGDGTLKMWRADAGDDTMTFAGAATTGGIKGGRIRCVDYAAGFWSCQAYTQSGGGSEATPFSATVN